MDVSEGQELEKAPLRIKSYCLSIDTESMVILLRDTIITACGNII